MRYLKSYKIFESNDDDLLDTKSDIEHKLRPLSESGIEVIVTPRSNESEYLIEISIRNCDDIEEFSDVIEETLSYLTGEYGKGWSLVDNDNTELLVFKTDTSYCEVPENPDYICPRCNSDEIDLHIDDDFTTRCDNCGLEDDRDEFRKYFRYFKDVDTLLGLLREGVNQVNIKIFKLI